MAITCYGLCHESAAGRPTAYSDNTRQLTAVQSIIWKTCGNKTARCSVCSGRSRDPVQLPRPVHKHARVSTCTWNRISVCKNGRFCLIAVFPAKLQLATKCPSALVWFAGAKRQKRNTRSFVLMSLLLLLPFLFSNEFYTYVYNLWSHCETRPPEAPPPLINSTLHSLRASFIGLFNMPE